MQSYLPIERDEWERDTSFSPAGGGGELRIGGFGSESVSVAHHASRVTLTLQCKVLPQPVEVEPGGPHRMIVVVVVIFLGC